MHLKKCFPFFKTVTKKKTEKGKLSSETKLLPFNKIDLVSKIKCIFILNTSTKKLYAVAFKGSSKTLTLQLSTD